MRLRKLELKDAENMLEWMHDESVVRYLSANFASKDLTDCQAFIEASRTDEENLNLAIVDEQDVYMGTVSLKHIDREWKMAEFAVTIRACAMGKGYSAYGMREIIRIGLEELGLEKIIWCVSLENARAVRFYDKNGYVRTTDIPQKYQSYYSEEQRKSFIWYVAQN